MIRKLFRLLSDLMTRLEKPSLDRSELDDCVAELTACREELPLWSNRAACSVRQAGRSLREAGGPAQATCPPVEVSVHTERHDRASPSRAPGSVSQVTCPSAQATVQTSPRNHTPRREKLTVRRSRPGALLSSSGASHHLPASPSRQVVTPLEQLVRMPSLADRAIEATCLGAEASVRTVEASVHCHRLDQAHCAR
jgi:hypothetical protein